mmetsp:Transcript_14306/g.38585  ORF Transcript_14306/g.38585 Transcript_14306/m.38585 type:complete len:268 (+) Transcript_14306:3631-4434(+)
MSSPVTSIRSTQAVCSASPRSLPSPPSPWPAPSISMLTDDPSPRGKSAKAVVTRCGRSCMLLSTSSTVVKMSTSDMASGMDLENDSDTSADSGQDALPSESRSSALRASSTPDRNRREARSPRATRTSALHMSRAEASVEERTSSMIEAQAASEYMRMPDTCQTPVSMTRSATPAPVVSKAVRAHLKAVVPESEESRRSRVTLSCRAEWRMGTTRARRVDALRITTSTSPCRRSPFFSSVDDDDGVSPPKCNEKSVWIVNESTSTCT